MFIAWPFFCKQSCTCCSSTADTGRCRIRRRRRRQRTMLSTRCCIIVIIIIISIVVIAVVTSVTNTYFINFNNGTINTRVSGYYYDNNKVGDCTNTNSTSSSNTTGYISGTTEQDYDDDRRYQDMDEVDCWTILWLVPQRWETNYIHDILQLNDDNVNMNKKSSSPRQSSSRQRRRRSLPICQVDSNRNGSSSTTKKILDYGNLKEADGLKLLGSLSSSSKHNNIFHNTIIVTSIRMGNHTLNTLVLNQLHQLRRRRHRKTSSGKTVLFLISEETNPYPNGWTSIISSYLSRFSISFNKQRKEGIRIGDGDRPCSNYHSKFNQLIRTTNIDVVLRNYWTNDCTTNTQYHQYQHHQQKQQQDEQQHQPTKYPKIIFVPLLITKMAYSTGYDKYCSSFSSSSPNLFEMMHSTDTSNISNTKTDLERYFKYGKLPKDRTTFLYFSSTHVMRHRSSFVDTAVSLAKSSKRSFIRSNNDQNNPIFVVSNNHQINNDSSSKDGNSEDTRNRIRRIVLKYPKVVEDDSSATNHDSETLQNRQQKRPTIEYAEALSDAQYAAVLKGNVDETWRFTESLFCGAIPLLQKSVWEYYSHWLPKSLMSLLPSYSNRHDLKSTLVKLAKQSQSDYESRATAVRSAATEWITNTRDYVIESIME